MRGDEDSVTVGALLLTNAAGISGAPVYAPSGKKLGVVESAAVDRYSAGVLFVIVSCRTLLGLRRARYLLPRAALTPLADGGGFQIGKVPDPLPFPRPLDEGPQEASDLAAAAPPDAQVSHAPLRLDPARAD